MKSIKITSLLTVFFLLSACGGKKASESGSGSAELAGTISIDGSSTVYPITEAVAEDFRTEAASVNVTIGVSGSGGGFKKFARGETDISNASRPIKDKEKEDCAKNNISYVELSVAYDGLAVVVNPDNTWISSITVAELKKIWEPGAQGKLMKWNQIRPEWPNEEIHLYGPGVASGTYDYFTEAIVGESGASRGDFTASEDDNVLVQGISGDKNGMGFFGLAYFEENKAALKLVAVDGGKGAILPSMETVKNGTYAPLSRPLFVYVNSTSIARPEVVSFVQYYLKNAGRLAGDVGYIPLPAELYTAEAKKFDDFVAGQAKVE